MLLEMLTSDINYINKPAYKENIRIFFLFKAYNSPYCRDILFLLPFTQ